MSSDPVDHPNMVHIKKNMGKEPENGSKMFPSPIIAVHAKRKIYLYFGNFSKSTPAIMKNNLFYSF